jgi:hypothetical protein
MRKFIFTPTESANKTRTPRTEQHGGSGGRGLAFPAKKFAGKLDKLSRVLYNIIIRLSKRLDLKGKQ